MDLYQLLHRALTDQMSLGKPSIIPSKLQKQLQKTAIYLDMEPVDEVVNRVLEEIFSEDVDNDLRNLFGFALAEFDSAESPTWSSFPPNSEGRRNDALTRLEFSSDEVERITLSSIADEAVETPLLKIDLERWSTVVVKGTECHGPAAVRSIYSSSGARIPGIDIDSCADVDECRQPRSDLVAPAVVGLLPFFSRAEPICRSGPLLSIRVVMTSAYRPSTGTVVNYASTWRGDSLVADAALQGNYVHGLHFPAVCSHYGLGSDCRTCGM